MTKEYPYLVPDDFINMVMREGKCTEEGKHALVKDAKRLAEIWNSCILGLNTVLNFMVDEGMPKDFERPTITAWTVADEDELGNDETDNNVAYQAGYAYASGYHD